MGKNKKMLVLVITLAIVVSALVIGVSKSRNKADSKSDEQISNSNDKLNENEIEQLREQYPIVKGGIATIDFVDETFSEMVENSKAIVDAKVIEELPSYELTSKIDEYNDTYLTVRFYPYKMEIVSVLVNNGIINEEDKYFTLVTSDLMLSAFPDISVGDEGIFPVFKGEGIHEEEYSFDTDTYYYVTEEGYVLSAYEEEKPYQYTGSTKDKLAEDIKSINKRKQ